MRKYLLTAMVAWAFTAAPAMAQSRYVFGNTDSETAPRATLTFDNLTPFVAVSTGWIGDQGRHIDNPNYLTGVFDGEGHNSFFSFALGALSLASPYTSATLTIKTGTSLGTLPAVLTLFDVDATLAELTQVRSSGDARGMAIYTDLGSGTSYGSYTFTTPTAIGGTIAIQLNQNFLNRVNSGLLNNFSIGGALTPSTSSAVPEPASWALMLIGFGTIGYALRRRADVRTRIRFI